MWTNLNSLRSRLSRQIDRAVDKIFPPPSQLILNSATRAKISFYILFAFASSIVARYFSIMLPNAFPEYAKALTSEYVDPTTANLFTSTSAVAATLWVVVVSVLALFSEATKVLSFKGDPAWWTRFKLVDEKVQTYWILVNAVAISACFQTALYFSVISTVPAISRWIVALSCYGAITLLVPPLVYARSYFERVSREAITANESFSRRIKRVRIYQERLVVQGLVECAGDESAQGSRCNGLRMKTVSAVLTELEARQKFMLRRMKSQSRKRTLLDSGSSVVFVRNLTYMLILLLTVFSGFPDHTVAIVVILLLLFIGMTISTRCLFTIMSLSAEQRSQY